MTGRYHGHRLRTGRYSQPGGIYHVTAVTKGRRRWFEEHDLAVRVCRSITDVDQSGATQTWCFVVMPDHVHWLFSLGERYSLSHTVMMLKSRVVRRMGLSVWQRGFHDHALREEESVIEVARYIVANPLRAGLVSRLADYPYWNAAWL